MGERVHYVLDDSQPFVRVARKFGSLIAWKLVVQIQNDSTTNMVEVQWHDGVTNHVVGTIAPQETTAFAADVVDWLTLQRAPDNPGVVVSGWYQILAATPQ